MNLKEFLCRLQGVRGSQGHFYARCPAHGDRHASLSVRSGEEGRILVKCHAQCSPQQIVAALGLTMADLYASPVTLVRPEQIWPYRDCSGQVQLEKRRYPGKEFRWFRQGPDGSWRNGRGGLVPALFNVDETREVREVYWVEGEKDVTTLLSLGLVAVSAPDGANGRLAAEQLTPLRGKSMVILPDNDGPGHAHAAAVAAALQGIAQGVKVLDLTRVDPDLPEKGDITDLVERRGGEVLARVKILAAETPLWSPPQTTDAPQLVFYDSVEFREPEFLVEPYLPLGKLTILQADSGVGKTALACKIAACVSRGMPMQDTPCAQGKVLILSVEDDPETLRGRIEASGGDLTQCAFLDNAHELTFESPQIEKAVKAHEVKLVIFDPLQAFLGSGIDMHRANQTRPIMAHLAAMAKRTGCAVLIISHMSKGSLGGKAIYRALGSVDIPAASRSVLYVERNPEDEDQCVMLQTKSSNAKTGRTILYRIGHRGGVTWEGYSSLTYQDVQMQAERRRKGVAYEEDPLVQVICMAHQDNPLDVFLSWEQLSAYANRALGYFPCRSGKEWHARLQALQTELMKKSRIRLEFGKMVSKEHMELGEKVPGSLLQTRGVRILPWQPQTAFQTRISG